MSKKKRTAQAKPVKPIKPVMPSAPIQVAPAPTAIKPATPRLIRTACYVDFENLFYQCQKKQRNFSVSKATRSLTRLSREIQGEGFAHTAVYANWDQISSHSRYAQSSWAELGWHTVTVPSREDRVSGRMVKNLVDFVMSLDILEDARDRGYEHIFLVSGDADFCEVVERVKRHGHSITAVSLGEAISYRLREAADQTVLWEMEDVSGSDTYPLAPARTPPRGPQLPVRPQNADEFKLLQIAYQEARTDQRQGPIIWEQVRDEYYLPMLGCSDKSEADLFIRTLTEAGFVTLKSQRTLRGEIQHQLTLNL